MVDFVSRNPVVEAQDQAAQRGIQLLPIAGQLEQRAYERNRETTDRAHLSEAARIIAEQSAPGEVQASTPPVAPAQDMRVTPAGAGEFGQEKRIAPPMPQANPLGAVRAGGDQQADRLRRAIAVGPAAAKAYGPAYLQHQQRQQATADKHSDMVLSKLGDGDIEGARQYAQVHGLNHLQPLFQNPQALTTVSSVSKLAKSLGLKDTHASGFVSTVMDGMQNGMSYDQAIKAAHQQVAKMANDEPVGPPLATNEGYIERTKGGTARTVKGPDGKVAMPPERQLTHRPPAPAGGAGGSRATQHADAKKKALMGIGWSEKDATEAAFGTGGKQITERDVIGVAKSLWATDQKQLLAKQRKFGSYEDALKAARGAMGQPGGAGGTPQPAAALLDAPRDPAQRKVDTVYKTPKGNLKWMGDGWEAPSGPAQ